MKRTKRLLSVFLTLCLLLGMLPTTARAASALSITQQPTAENGYKVTATYMNQLMDQGFQWYKKVDTATTYTLVEKNPKADELAVDAVYVGSYTNGHWEDGTGIFVSFLSSPGDEITVTVSGGEAPEGTLDETDITFTAVSSGVYTATSTGGMLSIRIESSETTVTATITVKRCWTPLAGQTSASLTASESGTYYCAVSKDGEGAITDIVNVVGPHSSHPVCGETCSHSGAHEDVTWTAWDGSNIEKSGNYYLENDITVSRVSLGKINTVSNVNLCLNGHTLTYTFDQGDGYYSIGVFYNCTWNICDCREGGKIAFSGSKGFGIYITYSSALNLYGGKLVTGKKELIKSNGAVNLYGGGVTAQTYSIVQNEEPATLTLSGAPEISGSLLLQTSAGASVADAKVDATSYTGDPLTVEEDSLTDTKAGAYAIKVSDGSKDKFTLTNADYAYQYKDGGLVIYKPHAHVWAMDWSEDETGHWHACTVAGCTIDYATCGEAGADYGPHVYDNDQDTDCDTCGYTRTVAPIHDHSWAQSWSHDDTGHWHECGSSGCPIIDNTQKNGYAAHAKAWVSTDADGHWEKCDVCGWTGTKATHVYTNDTDTTCNTCGYTHTIAPDKGEIKGEVETKQDTPLVTVDTSTLEELAGTPAANETITVKLTVEKQDNAEGKDEIEDLITAGEKDDVLYLDLSLLKITESTAGGGPKTENINEAAKVLEIVVPYSFTGKKDVKVYRYHDGTAQPLTEASTKADGTFQLSANSVIIYASKFSTYAIAYTPDSGGNQPPSGGGGTGGGTPPYTGGGGGYVPPTYPVALPASTPGGKLTASPKSASSGATVTLTPTPDEGYELGGVTVTDRNGKPVAVTAEKDGRYTFTMPSGGVTIKAEFVKRQGGYAACPRDSSCPIWPYTDASPTAWYHDALHFCLENGLMQGYGQGLLGPGRSVSRAEFVQMLCNREGRPAAGGFLAFEDVPNGAWYGDAVRWASVRGITGGYGNGQFGPSRSITRQELAVMLWRYAGSPAATDKELHFADADKVSGYAREALGWAVEHGIVQGKSGGILDPGGNATRAEAAAMLQRFCGKEK